MNAIIDYILSANLNTVFLLAFIGLFNAISELSNHGKLDHWWYWFSQAAWNNKNKWKPYPMWRWWPFIIFTDNFHTSKTIWVILMCLAIYWGGVPIVYSFCVYSISFTFFYVLLPFINVKK